ncbi:MAG: hypothetical protein PUD20_09210 [bacterium]|nr:hypothetical protein [bacterium]
MNMLVSGISHKDGKKIAYVRFEDGDCFAEAVIPECRVTKSAGFSEDEVHQLVDYMKNNLAMLKKQAAGINPIKAMMRSSD